MPIGRIILKSISDSYKLSKLKTDGARLLYTWLITHLDISGRFSGDPQVIRGKIFTRLNKTIKTIEGYLKDLELNKLIMRYEVNGDIFLYVPDFVEKQPSLNPDRERKSNIPPPTPELLQSYSSFNPIQDKISKDKINKINILSSKKVVEIINYLNKKSHKNFRPTTVKTINFIKARFNEKFNVDDFKKVIDVKTEQWLNKKEFSGFLRPLTLFGNKFESYLNESKESKLKKPTYFKAEDNEKSTPMPPEFRKKMDKTLKKIDEKAKNFNG